MFVTDHFVFLHLPKTAGVYVESVCQEDLKWTIHHTRRHAPVQELPIEFSHLPKIGIWRNPWDWHASLYFFARANKNEATSELISLASDGFKRDFEETLVRLMDPDEKLLKAYKERMEHLGQIKDIQCLKADTFERLCESGEGLMSFLAHEIFPEKLDVEWTVENLQKDFFSYIRPWVTDREKLRRALMSPHRNGSNKPDLRGVYNTTTKALVEKKEGCIIERFKYLPPT